MRGTVAIEFLPAESFGKRLGRAGEKPFLSLVLSQKQFAWAT